MSGERGVLCRGPYGGEGVSPGGGPDCADPGVFEVVRQGRAPLVVCPLHLGPSLLVGTGVLWPPVIRLVGRP
ncbi:hypothetical protein [Streptomyces sp. NPDC026659]|uniref:hypothetical protein n=1 Tax=Streptomyces sp. NPDC026659 TaxID=3155123 RepID=UPI0033D061DB